MSDRNIGLETNEKWIITDYLFVLQEKLEG